MKAITQLLEEQIKQEQSYIDEHNRILNILRGLEGKPFDGRTFSQKRLGDFHFIKKYGMYYIQGKYEHLIGYDSNPFVNSESFKKFDVCHGEAARKRLEQCKTLDAVRLQEISDQIKTSFENIKTQFRALDNEYLGSFYNPVYYEMIRNIYKGEKLDLSEFRYICNEKGE